MTKLTKEKLENGQPPSKYFSMTSIRTCEIYEWVALFFFYFMSSHTSGCTLHICLHMCTSGLIAQCIGLLLYTIEDRNYVLFTLTSPLQSAVCGILQVLKLAGRNEYACDKWISFGCIATMWVYLRISGEVFSWASVTCVSIWMGEEGTTRARRFGRGGQAGARKQETAGNRCDCLSGAHPVLCGLSKSGSMFSLPPGTF